MYHRVRLGFTLVELSIVLVIIGLLIGGILVGQSLIESSKLSATVKQINEFDAGVFAYTTKFKYLPGDNPLLGSDGGNGDGAIESKPNLGGGYIPPNDYTSMAGVRFSCETERFWKHLFPGKYSASTGCARNISSPVNWADHDGVQAKTSGAGKNVPLSRLGKEGSFFIVTPPTGDNGWIKSWSLNANFYMILDPSQAQVTPFDIDTTTISNSAYKPQQLLALDQKMDDGLANAGQVRAGRKDEYAYLTISSSLSQCSVAGVYSTTNDNYTCTPFIRVGGTNGNPK